MGERVVVFGIDPGTIATGYGVVAVEDGVMQALGWGRVATSSGSPLPERLARIHAEVRRQIEAYAPDEVAVENVFQAKNVKSALKLGHARGVVLLTLARRGLTVASYAPALVKRAVVGRGRAPKKQVCQVVKAILRMDEIPGEDEADALAIAICHLGALRAP